MFSNDLLYQKLPFYMVICPEIYLLTIHSGIIMHFRNKSKNCLKHSQAAAVIEINCPEQLKYVFIAWSQCGTSETVRAYKFSAQHTFGKVYAQQGLKYLTCKCESQLGRSKSYFIMCNSFLFLQLPKKEE